MTAIAQTDDHGVREGTLLLQLQSGLGEGLEWNRADDQVADLDGLEDDVDRLLGTFSRRDRRAGIILGESRKAGDGFLILDRQDGLRVQDLLPGRLPIVERDDPLSHAELHVALMLADLLIGPPGRIRGLSGDDAYLFERRPRRTTRAERVVIDVPRSAVGHRRDESVVTPDPRGHDPGELAVVIGRYLAGRHAANIMERVVGEQGQGLSSRVLDRQDGDVWIRWAGRTVEDTGRIVRIHLHLIHLAKRIRGHLTWLQIPATVEHFVRQRVGAGADQRGANLRMGLDDGLGDAVEHDLAIGVRLHLTVVELRAARHLDDEFVGCAHAGVRMCGGDQHVLRRDAGRLRRELLRFGCDALRDAEMVDHDPGHLGLAIIQHQSPRIQRIVSRRRRIGAEASRHVHGEQRRGDVRHGRAGLQWGRLQIRDQGDGQR